MQQFIDKFGAGSIRFVAADREFASKEWLAYLVKNKIGLRLRIKANTLITDKRGRSIHASQMLKRMKIGARAEFRRRRRLWNQSVFVAVCRKEDGDNVIVVSSERTEQILFEYSQRWQIETLFGWLKTRGFQLEDTHLTRAERISRMLSLLTLATVWGLLAGEIAARQAPPRIRKHGRAEKSIFRLGLEILRNCFCQLTTNFRQRQRFQQLTLLLSCT